MESQPQNPEFSNNPENYTHGLSYVYCKNMLLYTKFGGS